MSNAKQRYQNRATARELMRKVGPKHQCINCGEWLAYGDGHFAPPSLGEEGFFLCVTPEQQVMPAKITKEAVGF